MRTLLLALVIVGAMIAPGVASAAERPVPGCLGLNFEDPAGDAREAPSGLDVTGGFLTVRDGTVVVHVRFADLDLAAYPQPDDLYKTVRLLYAVDGRRYIVQATFNRMGSEAYGWGRGTRTERRNPGMAYPGRDGVVAMDLPEVAPGAEVTIGEIRTESYKAGGVEYEPDESMLRRTIDLAEGTSQAVACPQASSTEPPPPDPAPPATAEPQPQPQPQPQPGSGPPPAEPAARPEPPAVARKVALRARRGRGGTVRVTGRARGVRDGARVAVLRRGRVVARTKVRDGRFAVTVRRVARGARLRARVAGRVSAPVRVR